MGPLLLFNIFFTFLTLLGPLFVVSAQNALALDPTTQELITEGQPLRDNVLLYPLYGDLAGNKIDGLLSSVKFWSRQQETTCASNYSICQGSQICCPSGNVCCSGGTCCGAGTYCATVGGVQGCCQLGHVCSQVTDQCTVAGQQRCPNDNFCCPAGYSCYRDANNNPRCSSSDIPSSSGISSTPVPTNTSTGITFVSPPKQTGTSATHTSTGSPSLQTVCQLTHNPQGLLSRRGPTRRHSRKKRWGWF